MKKKILLSIGNASGLLTCWAGVVINFLWTTQYTIQFFEEKKPLDWGFVFLFALELVVFGGILIAISSSLAYVTSTELPKKLKPLLAAKLFGLAFLMLCITAIFQSYLLPKIAG